MYLPNQKQPSYKAQSDFWDSLWTEIMTSNQNLSSDDLKAYLEQSIMFSLFFRGCSYMEATCYQSILNIKNCGYMLTLELLPSKKTNSIDFDMDTLELFTSLKKVLKGINNSIGPYISNRIFILITDNEYQTGNDNRDEGLYLSNIIRDALHKEFDINTAIGISSVQNIKSIYTAFVEALMSQQNANANHALHIQDLRKKRQESQFDYADAEKHMLNSIRMRKTDAYDYFSLLMDYIKSDNPETMRNKILEILVMTAHTIRLDHKDDIDIIDYINDLQNLKDKEGDELINFAYQTFIAITGYVKRQNPINYTNRIVQATKEYLEAHYAEEITLEDVAARVNISPQYFSKLLKKTTGFNFIDWLSMLRVKKAKELLTDTNLTVKEVCFLVGYKDPNYFSRIFKKRIGITPSEFVKNSVNFNNMN